MTNTLHPWSLENRARERREETRRRIARAAFSREDFLPPQDLSEYDPEEAAMRIIFHHLTGLIGGTFDA